MPTGHNAHVCVSPVESTNLAARRERRAAGGAELGRSDAVRAGGRGRSGRPVGLSKGARVRNLRGANCQRWVRSLVRLSRYFW